MKKFHTPSFLSKRIYLFALLFLLVFAKQANSQEIYFDSKGTDFWLTFLPNYHNYKYSGDPSLKYGDSLYIFITSDEPTSGKITYTDQSLNTRVQNFTITNPNVIYIFKVSYFFYELLGFNDSSNSFERNQNEVVAKQSFHIESEKEITVYAHSQAVMTSDAFLVLPTDVLGNDYFALTYNSDGSTDFNNVSLSSTPSQFAVVATEDETEVQITPSAPTYSNNLNPQNVRLSKGDVYLVQAKITSNNLNGDLTGSQIKSNKPIAVFAGQQRATVPIKVFNENASRDFLVSQIPPVKTWGKNAFLVPYFQEPNTTTRGDDLYRILAAYENTEVFINDVKIGELDRGGFFQGELTEPAKVTSNNPILVAQFKKTAGDGGNQNLSDPFMMMIPPVEQFMKSYRFINIQAWEEGNIVYRNQYLTLISPNTSTNNITLDGTNINTSVFRPIPSSNYSYANIKVSDGIHNISAKEEVGIYIYGYGYANSYGYVGGMSFLPMDFTPPEIAYKINCFELEGFVYDSTFNDTGIKEIE